MCYFYILKIPVRLKAAKKRLRYNEDMECTSFRFEAIGTHWRIDLREVLTPLDSSLLLAAIMERIGVFDLAYSRFRGDSLVAEMSRKEGRYQLPRVNRHENASRQDQKHRCAP